MPSPRSDALFGNGALLGFLIAYGTFSFAWAWFWIARVLTKGKLSAYKVAGPLKTGKFDDVTWSRKSCDERLKPPPQVLRRSARACVRLGVLFGVCQANGAESLLQPGVQTVTTTAKQLVKDRVGERLESVRMAHGGTAQRVPHIRQVAILQALESQITHVNGVCHNCANPILLNAVQGRPNATIATSRRRYPKRAHSHPAPCESCPLPDARQSPAFSSQYVA